MTNERKNDGKRIDWPDSLYRRAGHNVYFLLPHSGAVRNGQRVVLRTKIWLENSYHLLSLSCNLHLPDVERTNQI